MYVSGSRKEHRHSAFAQGNWLGIKISKRQVALSNILVALEENRILAVFHKGKDGMQVNVM